MRQEVENSQQAPLSLIGYGLKEIFGSPNKMQVVDSNVLVNDWKSIDNLLDNGTNAVTIPWMVLSELDALKTNQDLSRSISDVVKVINQKLHQKDPNFYIAQGNIKDYPDLDPKNPDHHIIATCLAIMRGYPNLPVTLISNDAMVHTVGCKLGINVEEYKADQVNRVDFEKPLPRFNVENLEQLSNGQFGVSAEVANDVLPNTGAIIYNDDDSVIFPVIRKDEVLIPIATDLSALGIAPFSMDAEPNWAQFVALAQLLDPTITLVTLHGEAGTGKTLLSIAAALNQLKTEEDDDPVVNFRKDATAKKHSPVASQTNMAKCLEKAGFIGESRKRYRKIYIARPFIHLSNKDTMGFLPGNIDAKAAPWLAPISDNIDFISSRSEGNTRFIEGISKNNKHLEILPLSMIRGRTLAGAFVIIDEAQNLTRAEMKTIVTRAGENTKLVLVGDINQIDIRWIDKLSSGLTHVTVKMKQLPYFGGTFLDKSVRSQMAKDAAELL